MIAKKPAKPTVNLRTRESTEIHVDHDRHKQIIGSLHNLAFTKADNFEHELGEVFGELD